MVLPLSSAVLQAPKSVRKPVSPSSLGADVCHRDGLNLGSQETLIPLPLERWRTMDVLKEPQQLLPVLEALEEAAQPGSSFLG